MDLKQVKGLITGNYGKLPHAENAQLVRAAAADGIVLLKNNGILPLRSKILALFGAGAVDTVICGFGSGYAFPPYTVTVKQGLENAGIRLTSGGWLSRFEKESRQANKNDKTMSFIDKMWSGKKIMIDEPKITAREMLEAKSGTDTAVYVIRRNAGEEDDRTEAKGDYYLSDQERANLEAVAENFSHVIVVLNTCVIDANFVNEIPGIDATLYLNLPGMEGGNALADVLLGKVNPSGRLTDTWAKEYTDYPASATFSSNDGITLQEDYTEGIYVGYRWFDSFGIEPLYPFGYGLSYTDFTWETEEITADWKRVCVRVRVTNTGRFTGRQVLQLYASAPAGRLDKPYQELKAFGKTKDLDPGESQVLELSFSTEILASFDETQSAWVMEAGDYLVLVGEHSRQTRIVGLITLDAEAVTRRVTDVLHMDKPLETVKPGPYPAEEIPEDTKRLSLSAALCVTVDNVSRQPKETVTYVAEGDVYTPYAEQNPYQLPWPCGERIEMVRSCPEATFLDVYDGKVTIEEFVASLPPEVLTRIVTGTLEETPFEITSRMKKKVKPLKAPQSSGQTTAQYVSSLGIPTAYFSDGPAGMHIFGCASTSFPVGICLAQTWDEELIRETGIAYAHDMEHYHVAVGLGPGMNIHRDPLCGRNFEYYSEDPLVSGKAAAAFTKGVQSCEGCGVSIKHFATNNQENDRAAGNNTVSIRTLREIYLKGFEICVREADPATVMTCYNKLNGFHTSENRELITDVLRGEWGFEGYVMTDWGTTSEKGWDLHAGNDLIMGGYRVEKLLAMMKAEEPVFNADGSVKEDTKSTHFGMVKTTLSRWGCFVPESDGTDTVQTTVPAGEKISEKVTRAQKEGLVRLEKNADGSTTVIWKGTRRGAYLPLGDLQACAIRVLKGMMASSAMKEMLGQIR